MNSYLIKHYLTAGKHEDLYMTWLNRLRDRQAKIAVIRRLLRVQHGNFGDHKFCRDGVWELRIDIGAGYRVYYAQTEPRIVLLSFCFVVATNAHRTSILPGLWVIGKIGNRGMKMKSRGHDEAMAELYRNDPALALDVINSVLEEGDQGELLTLLRQLTQAFGGVQAVADQADLNATQLYRTLSPEGNPTLNSLLAILKVMGLRLAVQPLDTPVPAHAE